MTARIELLRTAGNADPAGPPVHENNVWLVGDDTQVVVIDPAHDAEAVAAAVAGRRVSAVLLTHGHWDHVRAAVDFCRSVGQEPRLHPADAFLWRAEHGGTPFVPLTDGETFEVAGTVLEARHTPGHTPGRHRSSPPTSAPSSAGTPCSRVARARPAGSTPRSTGSSPPSPTGC